MSPWERRLKDLSFLLNNCHRNYFEPELFRLNLNQYLQTSRTITFILQKNKKVFQSFDWYDEEMLHWANDNILIWAKDSRNTIEKIGDLDLNSEIRVSLITSYLESQDRIIKFEDRNLLFLAVDILVKLIKGKLSFIADDEWAIKVERIWIANSLPNEELLRVINYIYMRQYLLCKKACYCLGNSIDESISSPIDMDSLQKGSRHIRYIDSALNCYKELKMFSIEKDIEYKQGKNFIDVQKKRLESIDSFESALYVISENARELFIRDGCHVPILFAFDSRMELLDMMSVCFGRRVEKFIFWRQIAERVSILPVHCFFFISEVSLKEMPLSKEKYFSVTSLPTRGEALQVFGITDLEQFKSIAFMITRSRLGQKSLSEPIQLFTQNENDLPTFLIPVKKAMSKRSEIRL